MNWDVLDKFEPESFKLPLMRCGYYTLIDSFGVERKYQFRRMPRAAGFEGRFGLFYYDPDAHWLRIAVFNHEKGQFEPIMGLPKDISAKLSCFIAPETNDNVPILSQHMCAWCGKTMPEGDRSRFTHQSKACDRDPYPEDVGDSGIVGNTLDFWEDLPF